MRPNGVSAIVLAAVALALIPLGAAQAVTPPKCWKGAAGCRHSETPSWDLTSFSGSVSAVGTRPPRLTCADLAGAPRDEIIEGRYTVAFKLDRARSETRVGVDAARQPKTADPLSLRFAVTQTTHELVRTLTPSADGTACTEATRSCDKSGTVGGTDRLDVFTRNRRVNQNFGGTFVNNSFLECAGSADVPSLLPSDPLDGSFLTRTDGLSTFRHRSVVVTTARDRQIGDGSTSINLKGKLTYARSIRACTYYAGTKKRCRTARG